MEAVQIPSPEMKKRELFPDNKGSLFQLDNTFAGAELEKKYKDDLERYNLGEIGKIFPCHIQMNRQTNDQDLNKKLRLHADKNEFNDLFDLITK